MSNTNLLLPALHAGQRTILQNAARFNQVRCGRRWGKTFMLVRMAAKAAAMGQYVGVFTPQYSFQAEVFREIHMTLRPVMTESNKTEGVIRTIKDGRVDFWTLLNPAAGRGRKYHRVLIDEAAFGKPIEMTETWERAIEPTLLDYKGDAFAFSTPNGIDPDNWFYQTSLNPRWRKFTAPTSTNPYMDKAELEAIKERTHPQVWQQEFLAEFVDWSGVAFFRLTDLMDDGNTAPPIPEKIHGGVFAIIDSAVKTGQEHDATGIIYFALQPGFMYEDRQARLFILDWDLKQVEGGTLLQMYPEVNARLEHFAALTQATHGQIGTFVEDKVSGTIMLQQAQSQGLERIYPIDSKLTAMGKDERALAASPYVASNVVRLTAPAYDKIMCYKGVTRNHLLTQVIGFRLADKDAAKRQDDLLDCFTYGVVLGVGNYMGM